MISYLATIAFAAKSRQMFEHPGKIFPRICVVAMIRTIARHFTAYFIHFVNTQ
jgi:hypothetical protein